MCKFIALPVGLMCITSCVFFGAANANSEDLSVEKSDQVTMKIKIEESEAEIKQLEQKDSTKNVGVSLVDPTKPIGQKATVSVSGSLTINSIIIAENRNQVIINGKKMKEGSTSGGLKVVKIRKNSVVVIHKGKEQTLTFHKSFRKNVSNVDKNSHIVNR